MLSGAFRFNFLLILELVMNCIFRNLAHSFLASILMFAVSNAHAQWSTQELTDHLRNPETKSLAGAYVVGVLEGATLAAQAIRDSDGAKVMGICPRKGSSIGDVVTDIGAYLLDHPELKEMPAKASVLVAANKTQSCSH